MVSFTVTTPGKPKLDLEFAAKSPDQITVNDLKTAIQAKLPKLVSNRQRITIPVISGKPTPLLDESRSLGSYGVTDGAQLRLKDLGRQVGYVWLYVWEYIGPLFLVPLGLEASHLLWGKYPHSQVQLAIRNLFVIHFLKRVLESIFVHRFSRPSVPLKFVFQNIAYYWGMVGVLVPLTLFRPPYSATALKGTVYNNAIWVNGWTAFVLAMELLNLNTHLHLRSLRTPPGQPRKFPTGLGFGQVVCANYWFEILGIIGMIIMTSGDFGLIAYSAVGVYYMTTWAGQKTARYKKEFDTKVFPGKRYKMFPPIY